MSTTEPEGGPSRRYHPLDEEKVLEIKRLLYIGETQLNIAEQFGISQTIVSSIKRNRIWRQVAFHPSKKDRDLRGRIRSTFGGSVA